MEVTDMRATLNIPDDLLSEVQNISKEKSKTRAIVTAMESYVRDRKMTELLALRGKMTINYDWLTEEKIELQAQGERDQCNEK
jgi:metal-responsive CopG/Arc/MetJ family transcriptional regulator